MTKNCPKSVQNRQKKGGFSSKMANIDSKYQNIIHSFHDKIQFKGLFIINFFQEYLIQKIFNNLFFQKIQFKNWFKNLNLAFFQFNKIFIQLENQGIKHHYIDSRWVIYNQYDLGRLGNGCGLQWDPQDCRWRWVPIMPSGKGIAWTGCRKCIKLNNGWSIWIV